MKITATIRYVPINMGFWALEAEGKKYEVLNMPPQLMQDGAKTVVWIKVLQGVVSHNMYGAPVQILGFETV